MFVLIRITNSGSVGITYQKYYACIISNRIKSVLVNTFNSSLLGLSFETTLCLDWILYAFDRKTKVSRCSRLLENEVKSTKVKRGCSVNKKSWPRSPQLICRIAIVARQCTATINSEYACQ